MTKLHDLYDRYGQSPWLDDLGRRHLTEGRLAELVEAGVRGVTSNPTIFARSIEGSDAYDAEFAELLRAGATPEEAYWEMVIHDVAGAADVLRPVFDTGHGTDGFVSLEVAPALAHDAEATVAAVASLHDRVGAPNVLVKIPATKEGLSAIRASVAAGRNVNVTLIFGLERYSEVIEAYLAGLEDLLSARGASCDLSDVASVASFFVSRVDTEVDRRLDAIAARLGEPAAARVRALRGKAAVAQAKLAYRLFVERFSGGRWEALAARGAQVQRPLWASTSTKNPAYPDLLYVDGLIGPSTVNTMPEATLEAFLDHGRLARTVDADLDEAETTLGALAEVGIDLGEVSALLEEQGVAAFSASFDELLERLSAKALALAGRQ